MTDMDIARVTHQVNKAYCEAIGDNSQKCWEDAPDWQKQSALNGVTFVLEFPMATPEDNHNEWLKGKAEAGWVYGPVKDEEAKTHPCILPYDELPLSQRAKDYIFKGVVLALSGYKVSVAEPKPPGDV